MSRIVTTAVLAIVLLTGFALVGTGSTDAEPTGVQFVEDEVDPDDILLSVNVQASGEADWTIEYRTRLDTDEDRQAFDNLSADVQADPAAYSEPFRDRMETTASEAALATDREMAITELTVRTERRELPQEYGVLVYEFTWVNFAVADDDQLVIGDAIDGMFLDEESTLQISWPAEYDLVEASPEPTVTRDRTVVWEGPVTFTRGEPRVTVEQPGLFATLPLALLGFVVVIIVGAGLAIVFTYRRQRGEPATPAESQEPTAETRDAQPGDDWELLSNEEKVLRLIEDNGGRMKQKALADELGWTAARTSQVVTKLREDDELDGYRLGRENVLQLPDEPDPGE